jgi:hypothetical protein
MACLDPTLTQNELARHVLQSGWLLIGCAVGLLIIAVVELIYLVELANRNNPRR